MEMRLFFKTSKAPDVTRGMIQMEKAALCMDFTGSRHTGLMANILAWKNLQMKQWHNISYSDQV